MRKRGYKKTGNRTQKAEKQLQQKSKKMSKRATTERKQVLQDAAEKNLPLTQDEIASLLQVSKGTIQSYARQGMPVIYLGKKQGGRGSNPRYKYQDCMAWLEKKNVLAES